VGEIRNPSDPASQGLKFFGGVSSSSTDIIDVDAQVDKENVAVKVEESSKNEKQTLRLKFRVSNAGGGPGGPPWEAILWKGRLYVHVSKQQLHDGSKEAFVTLLEYAEETLGVSHVIVCLDRFSKETKGAIRNFMFLGFQPLAPGHEFRPVSHPNLVCFVYTI